MFSNLVFADDFVFNGIISMYHGLFYVFRSKIESTLALKNKRNTIEEPMEKQEIWAFTDIECRVDKKIAFKWNNLFQAFHKK